MGAEIEPAEDAYERGLNDGRYEADCGYYDSGVRRGVQDTLERLRDPAAVERAAKAIDAYLPMTAGNYIVSEAAFRSAVAAALDLPESEDA